MQATRLRFLIGCALAAFGGASRPVRCEEKPGAPSARVIYREHPDPIADLHASLRRKDFRLVAVWQAEHSITIPGLSNLECNEFDPFNGDKVIEGTGTVEGVAPPKGPEEASYRYAERYNRALLPLLRRLGRYEIFPPPSLVLTVALSKSVYAVGEKVRLKVQIENQTSKPMLLPASMLLLPKRGLRFILSRGKEPWKSSENKKTPEDRGKKVWLAPHYFWGSEFFLNDYCSLSKPGSYRLQCIYDLDGSANDIDFGGASYADLITFRVVDAPGGAKRPSKVAP